MKKTVSILNNVSGISHKTNISCCLLLVTCCTFCRCQHWLVWTSRKINSRHWRQRCSLRASQTGSCPVCFTCMSNKAHAPQHHARQLSRPTTLTHDNRQHSHARSNTHARQHSRTTTSERSAKLERTTALMHDST
jgi:hypothetical protein